MGSGDTLEFRGALSVASLEACFGVEGAEAHLEDVLIPGVVVSEAVYTGWFDCDPVPYRVMFDRGPEPWAQPAFSCTPHSIVVFLAAPPPSLHP